MQNLSHLLLLLLLSLLLLLFITIKDVLLQIVNSNRPKE